MIEALCVAQATAWYPPNHMGGTEVYVNGLVRELGGHGVRSVVITPDDLAGRRDTSMGETRVRTYAVPIIPSNEELQRSGPYAGFDAFRKILATERPQIYHQHSWSRGLGRFHLKAAREAGLRTVLTIHAANFLCMRGTMMRFGAAPCNGQVETRDCSACWSHARGAPRALSHVVAAVPPQLGRFLLERRNRFGRPATLLATTHLVEQRKREMHEAVANSDLVIAVCEWLYNALVLNGMPKSKLVLNRQGVDLDVIAPADEARLEQDKPAMLRLVFLGRSDPSKGAHILVEAAARIADNVRFHLDLHLIGREASDRLYQRDLLRLANGDSRIRILGPVARDQIMATLARADFLAVPALGFETGPLVVSEAKAMGLKIVGSRLGGIAELVDERTDGILVNPGSVDAWASTINSLAVQYVPSERARNRTAVRTMNDVAAEMFDLYQGLL